MSGKECGHSTSLTYPANDGWRCTVCDSLIEPLTDSLRNPRVNNSESRKESERSVETGGD